MDEEEKFVCGECGRKFASKAWLTRHVNEEHPGRDEPEPEAEEPLEPEEPSEEDEPMEEEEAPPGPLCNFFLFGAPCCGSRKPIYLCTSSDKAVLDPSMCKDEYTECPLYEKGLEEGKPRTCPYQGFGPEGQTSWCYAKGKGLRTVKGCRKWWTNCTLFALEKWHGRPFYKAVA